MNIALRELIFTSIALNSRAKLEDKSVNEVYSSLSARDASSGVAAHSTLAVKLYLFRQTLEQSIQNYIAKFFALRAQFGTYGGEIDLQI